MTLATRAGLPTLLAVSGIHPGGVPLVTRQAEVAPLVLAALGDIGES